MNLCTPTSPLGSLTVTLKGLGTFHHHHSGAQGGVMLCGLIPAFLGRRPNIICILQTLKIEQLISKKTLAGRNISYKNVAQKGQKDVH